MAQINWGRLFLGSLIAAIIMFVGNGGTVLSQAIRSWMGVDRPPDQMLVNALLLNVALLIFGWRRYVDLTREVEERRVAEKQACLLAMSTGDGSIKRTSPRSMPAAVGQVPLN